MLPSEPHHAPSDSQKSRGALQRRELVLIAAVALAVRVAYFTAHLASPLVDVPALDAHYFDLAARSLAQGEIAPGLATGFRSLLFPLLLSGVYRIAGEWNLYAALALQHLIGVGTALIVAALGWRLFRHRAAGLLAGLLYALGAPPLYFEGELLVETLFTFTVAAQLLALVSAEGSSPRRALALAALAGALAAVGFRLRPNHLLFVAALPLLLLRKSTRPGRLRLVASALVAAIGVGALLAACELPASGRLQLVPSAGGVNLYLGNKRSSDGMIPRQDWSVTYAEEYRDSVEVFAEQAFLRASGRPAGAPIAPGELTRYWFGRTAGEFAADPVGRLALLGKKALLFFWNAEIPNHRSFDFAAHEEVRLLAYLPVRFGLVLALALAGLCSLPRTPLTRRRREILLLFLVVHAAGVVAFFVNDRYRLPVWPPIAALAGGGLAFLVARARRRRWRQLARPASASVAGVLLAFVNWSGSTLPGPGRDLLFRSVAELERGDLVAARRDAERAAALEAHEVSPLLQLGNVCTAMSDDLCAERAYRAALERHPRHVGALSALAELDERRGRANDAHALFCAALVSEPGFPPALLGAAWLELRAGRDEAASAHLAALPPRARGQLRVRLAEAELARRLSGVMQRPPIGIHPSEEDEAQRLLSELDRPLAPEAVELCPPE